MSKDTFKPIFDRVIAHEGGYVNDPRDAGGETHWGVTKRTARANGYTGDMRDMTRDDAFDIYYSAFWLRYHCDDLPKPLAFQFFDACVNHGFGNAARMLQRAVGVVDDGVIGKITLSAVSGCSNTELVLHFNAERLRFYTNLKSFATFGRGWTRRVAKNLDHGGVDSAGVTLYGGVRCETINHQRRRALVDDGNHPIRRLCRHDSRPCLQCLS